MEKELLLFQLGPVQEFIAQAATPEDLWAGSYLLSRLMWAGTEKAKEFGADFIFPSLTDGRVREALFGRDKIPTIPHRFLAEVAPESGATVAKEVKKAVKHQLDLFARATSLPEGGQTQVDQFLQMTWAVLPAARRTGRMKQDYEAVMKTLSARRNLRDFGPWQETVATGPKDFLTGKETALSKGRGALNLIKLDLPNQENKQVQIKYPDDDTYIAVVAMDGDEMGKRLSGLQSREEHQTFSAGLVEFAAEAIRIVRDYGGTPIYVGGDDVLAVFPSKLAVAGVRELEKAFSQYVGGTASAGVAIGHEKAPMQELVVCAQAAEHKAKHVYGRCALVVDVLKRSGEIVSWGGHWNSKGVDILVEFREIMQGTLFKRFPYKLTAFLGPYELEKVDAAAAKTLVDVIEAEYRHAWKQCVGSEVEGVALDLVTQYFGEVAEGTAKAVDFLNVFRCETFINRPRDVEEDDK